MLRDLKLNTKLALLVGLFTLGFIVFGLVTYSTLQTQKSTLDALKINGPMYHDIVQSKDVIADILPPPEYILESYLVLLRMSDEFNRPNLNVPTQGETQPMLKKFKTL